MVREVLDLRPTYLADCTAALDASSPQAERAVWGPLAAVSYKSAMGFNADRHGKPLTQKQVVGSISGPINKRRHCCRRFRVSGFGGCYGFTP